MADRFGHPSYKERLNILNQPGLSNKFDGWTENIYSSSGMKFAESAHRVFNSWMNSPGHRALIVSEGDAISSVSAGCHITESGDIYWILVAA